MLLLSLFSVLTSALTLELEERKCFGQKQEQVCKEGGRKEIVQAQCRQRQEQGVSKPLFCCFTSLGKHKGKGLVLLSATILLGQPLAQHFS